ncbi:MAG: archaemetzincin family Zn-dependent metalloprotease [candidate division Zixibacteria bacterium]|nr:archaemetzincin family Zn-dependent metalloprotease [candidate division Zixibacteria bacterium]
MTPRLIKIVPLNITDKELMSGLAAEITRIFPFRCRVGAPEKLPVELLDENRGQYHATRILKHLATSDQTSFRLLGVTTLDVFTPILRYVFGEAMLNGRAALISTYRLLSPPPGPGDDFPLNRRVFVSRVLKEGIHELGHTFGLTHCDDPTCVMAASLDTTNIDAKSAQLCYYCKIMLKDELEKN